MRAEAIYDERFFEHATATALQASSAVVPLLWGLVRPKSVLDVGCGRGAWLKAFQDQGASRLLGLDGAYVDRDRFLVDAACFRPVDLTRPVELDETFDLAVCLEVAEHLPRRHGRRLVELLTRAAPLVLFSAAVPGQGGTSHLNEQWPAYWASRFAELGYRRLDPVRRHICQDPRVAVWYQQNLFLFASLEAVTASAALQAEEARSAAQEIDFVSARIFGRYQSVTGLLSELPRALWRAARNRAGW